MYLSHSGFDTHEGCNREFYYKYVAKLPVLTDNRVTMLYGDTTGKLFEDFYKHELWRSDPVVELNRRVVPTLQRVIKYETNKGGTFNWADPKLKEGSRSLADIEADIRATIPRGLRSIQKHKLMSKQVRTEYKLDTEINGHLLAGRADFVMRRVHHNDYVIVDGKGTAHRDKYTNIRQLRWYAMLHRERDAATVDRIGFLYWKESPETSMDWYDVTASELDAVRTSALRVAGEIESKIPGGEKAFLAQPGERCSLCRYLPSCPEGQASRTEAAKAARKAAFQLGVEDGDVSF